MSTSIQTGALMMRAGMTLPPFLSLPDESYVKGWNILKADRAALGHEVSRAGWHLIFIPGQLQATGVGFGDGANVRQAMRRILDQVQARRFNCLGVTEIIRRRFLGIPYVTVRAHSYQLQEGSILLSSKRHGSHKP